MDRLRRNARDNPAERVPDVVWEYTTRRTLVMEFFDGVTVLDYLRAAAAGDDAMLARLRADRVRPGDICPQHDRQLPGRRVPARRCSTPTCTPRT